MAATRGDFAPPTLRPLLMSVSATSPSFYEGRIRPSYIAAFSFPCFGDSHVDYEGRIRPSYIAATVLPVR